MAEIAVIKTGGKQYKVHASDELSIEKLADKVGDKIKFDDILGGKKVQAVVLEHFRGPKIRILKFKAKARYTKRMGHRQDQTKIKIDSIV